MTRDPSYSTILTALEEGRVVPFLGAGASLAGRPDDAAWTEAAEFPPRGDELSTLLANEGGLGNISKDPRDSADLMKASAYFEQQVGRPELLRRLHRVLAKQYRLGALQEFLASLTGLRLIVTTNYDTLLERAFVAAGQPFLLVVHAKDSDEAGNTILLWRSVDGKPEKLLYEEFEKLQVDLTTTRVIYKMHGTVDDRTMGTWDNFVITEDDYIDFLSRMTSGTAVPKSFLTYFRGRSFLFLGYSLNDWNLRVLLRNLGREFEAQSQRRAGSKHWAIQRAPSPIEQWLWELRSVNLYDLRLEDFVTKLKAARGSHDV